MSADITDSGPRLLIYNPQLWERDALLAAQTGRDGTIDALLDTLRIAVHAALPRHPLLLGEAGAGKTMLACCACYAINEDAQLRQQCLAVRLPEQQLNIAELSDLYTNAVQSLATQLSCSASSPLVVNRLRKALERRAEFESHRNEVLWRALEDAASALQRRLVLVVDNLDKTAARLSARSRKQWLQRLNDPSGPVWIGTATAPANSALQRLLDGATFEPLTLAPLSASGARALLRSLAERHRADGVARLVRQQPQRVDTLTALAGRQPRSLALLFEALTSHCEVSGQFQLEGYLDRRTPQFEARIEALPAQAQQVFDALARRLAPARAAELATALRLETNAVSSQLHRLVKLGLVEKVPYDPPRRAGFQVAERTMNLWYLMRAGGLYRRKLATVVAYRRMSQQTLLRLSDSRLPAGATAAGAARAPDAGAARAADAGGGRGPLHLSKPELQWLLTAASTLAASWPEAVDWATRLATACEQREHAHRFQGVVWLLREVVQQGAAASALTLLQRLERGDRESLAEHWLPLLVPLRAVVAGHQLPLRRLAPELRGVANAVLEAITDGAPPAAEPSRPIRYRQ